MLTDMETTKTRKAHKKSRNGCLPCKDRHVKCDETKPECVNCNKYRTKCEYPPAKKRGLPSDNDSVSPYPVTSTPSPTGGIPPTQPPELSIGDAVVNKSKGLGLNIRQLRLLHHFTMVTAKTLAADSRAEGVYQTYIIELGFVYQFLLHNILALAALHLSRLRPPSRSEYLAEAASHHEAALTQFRTQIPDITEDNFKAVLFFASTLFPYSIAIPIDISHGMESMFDSILSNLALTRRVRPMVSVFYKAMLESEVGHIVPMDIQGIDWEHAEPPEDTELVTLRKFSDVASNLYPPDIVEAYSRAIRILDLVFSVARESPHPPSDSLIKMWIHMLTPRFLDLLSERQPGALVIFAHYGVLLGRCQHYWFLDGVGEQIIRIAEAFVPSEWKSWLDWPREQIVRSPPCKST